MSSSYLTISVDDGHPADRRVSEILAKYELPATFYIPKSNPEREVMTDAAIREIATRFDIGAHTISHLSLHTMPDSRAFSEIVESKKWLEGLLGRSVTAFCYPQGKFSASTPQLIQKAGFRGARTSMFNLNGFPRDPYLWGLSTHAYSHSPRIQFQHALVERNFRGALNYIVIHKTTRDWADHFRNALDHVEHQGGIAHLYFHSWEIDQQGDWRKLEQVLEEASKRKTFTRVNNSELFELWHQLRHQGKAA